MTMLLVAAVSFVLGGIIIPITLLWIDGFIDMRWELRRARQEIARRCEFAGRPRRRAVVTCYRRLRHRHKVESSPFFAGWINQEKISADTITAETIKFDELVGK